MQEIRYDWLGYCGLLYQKYEMNPTARAAPTFMIQSTENVAPDD